MLQRELDKPSSQQLCRPQRGPPTSGLRGTSGHGNQAPAYAVLWLNKTSPAPHPPLLTKVVKGQKPLVSHQNVPVSSVRGQGATLQRSSGANRPQAGGTEPASCSGPAFWYPWEAGQGPCHFPLLFSQSQGNGLIACRLLEAGLFLCKMKRLKYIHIFKMPFITVFFSDF